MSQCKHGYVIYQNLQNWRRFHICGYCSRIVYHKNKKFVTGKGVANAKTVHRFVEGIEKDVNVYGYYEDL